MINAWQARQIRNFFQRSVISCNVDKSPCVFWGSLQSSLISDAQIDMVFAQPAVAIAVITGGHLLCVDLDTTDAVEIFRREFPDLWNTHRNRTVRGYHLFYTVTTEDNLTNKRGDGVDFLHEGCYALLPPSPGKTPDQAGPLCALSAAEIGSMLTYFQLRKNEDVSWQPSRDETLSQFTPVSLAGLVNVYHERRRALGSRNAALYRTAAYARSVGVAQAVTESALIDVYVQSPAPPGHKRESATSRARAGRATINSAYTRAAYAVKHLIESLPAAAHQVMSQRKHTAAARALDKLYKSQWTEATQAELQALDTDWGMRRLVDFLLVSDLCEIKRFPPNPPAERFAEYPTDTPTEKQNVFAEGHNQQKPPNAGGRPLFLYSIPTARQVCDWLGVQHWWIDPIDLSSLAAKTPLRLALLRGLLTRLGPTGRCSLPWQATVFGVNRKTVQRWHKLLGVISQHPGRILSGVNLRRYFPDENRQADCWIQDSKGKRYPAKRVIAAQLWASGKTGLSYHRRADPNCYYLPSGSERPVPYQPAIDPAKMPDSRSQIDCDEFYPPVSWNFPSNAAPECNQAPLSRSDRLLEVARSQYGLNWHFADPPEQTPGPAAYVPRWGADVPGTPLIEESLEDVAILLYNELNRRAQPDQRIRADKMRELVSRYGPDPVRTVVKRLTGRIHNPVAYVIGCLVRERNTNESPAG